MKVLATLCSIILTTVSFSQEDGLVYYQIDATTDVNSIRISAQKGQDDIGNALGRIESICDSTILLQLNPDLDYNVLINNSFIVEVNRDDIAAYTLRQNTKVEGGENEFKLAFQLPAADD